MTKKDLNSEQRTLWEAYKCAANTTKEELHYETRKEIC